MVHFRVCRSVLCVLFLVREVLPLGVKGRTYITWNVHTPTHEIKVDVTQCILLICHIHVV